MDQVRLTQGRSFLLQSAISRLSPEVFTHPVWVRFGDQKEPESLITADALLNTVKMLQETDPATACQILLICAVYQNNASQHFYALKTSQQAVTLARRSHLCRETIWALWGLCAISIQQGNTEQASAALVDLQATLSEQDEWILTNFVDVFRQTFFHAAPAKDVNLSDLSNDPSYDDLLAFTFNWLQQWGSTLESTGGRYRMPDHSAKHSTTHKAWMQFMFSIQRWKGQWRNFILAIRGEIKLHWTVEQTPSVDEQISFRTPIQHGMVPPDQSDISQPEHRLLEIQDSLLPAPPQEIATFPPATHRPMPEPSLENASPSKPAGQETVIVPVAAHVLGAFSLTLGGVAVKVPASRGVSLLKYMLLHHKQNTPREVLMDVFWPEADPELARNNLNVSMHSLRRALRSVTDRPVVLFEGGAYGFAPQVEVWLDVEEFEKCIKNGQRLEARGQLSAAIDEYETAISLYQGDLLEQNPYDEWTVLDRERLRIAYLDTLDRLGQIYFSQERYAACITVCQLILARDRCREDAHCLLMRCYSRQGQHHLALRQYQMCVEALRSELQVEPAPETTQLYNRIRRREQV